MRDPSGHEPDFIFQRTEDESLAIDTTIDSPHRTGGPRTPDGKSRSSRNSVKHGCRSNIVILCDEKQEELDALYDRWQEAYQPDTEAALELLEQFVLSKWYLLRNERRYAEVEEQLSHFPYTSWSDGQHKIFQLTVRYKTAAERAASKAQHDLEAYLKNRRAQEKHRQQLDERAHASLLEIGKDIAKFGPQYEQSFEEAAARDVDVSKARAAFAAHKLHYAAAVARFNERAAAFEDAQALPHLLLEGQSPKQLRATNVLQQRIEVTVRDGLTVTELTPSNQQLMERGQIMQPPPALVYRRLSFPDGVPDEYGWATDIPLLRMTGGLGKQRMSVETWLALIETEKLRNDGHIGICPPPLSHPDERDDGDCQACTRNHERLKTQ